MSAQTFLLNPRVLKILKDLLTASLVFAQAVEVNPQVVEVNPQVVEVDPQVVEVNPQVVEVHL